MDRRQFLRTAAIGGAAAMAGRSQLARAAFMNTQPGATSILNGPASSSPIDTIVILMMENRSFDHYLGWLPADEAYMHAGRERYGPGFTVDGRSHQSFPGPKTGKQVQTYHLTSQAGEHDPWRGCGHPDPGHGPLQGRAQRDHGFLANGSGNDAFALGYFTKRDLPTYAPLAHSFTVFDRYYASLLSSTYPNRLYLQSAQCGDNMDPGLPIAEMGYAWPSIWDRLGAAGVSRANYFVDVPSSLFFGARLLPMMRPIADFFVDAAVGQLPNVVMIDPGWLTGFRTDDHPVGDMRVAQAFVANIIKALTKSPQWRRSALIITYDEWGGFFDHVAPPLLPDRRASKTDTKNFGQAGFRVPTFMVSPYALPNYVDHRTYDHASILRFIEWRFLGAPPEGPGGTGWWLTDRDRYANNIGASLQTAYSADIFVSPVPEVPLASTPCENYWFQDVPVLKDSDLQGQFVDIERPISGMELLVTSGYAERVGLRQQRPSMSLRELINR